MTLTVLNVAYPLEPVGFDAVGGAEQVIAMLDAELARAGHHSIVIGREGSTVRGTLIATPEVRGDFDELAVQRIYEQQRRAMEKALARWPIDVVHLHALHFYRHMPSPGVPVLVTLHLMPNWYPPHIFWPPRPMTFLHCVSTTQHRSCPPGATLLPVIENGVQTDRLATNVHKRNFAIAVGRICPEKGFHLALDAATRTGIRMLLAGQVSHYETHQDYFQREIVPRIQRGHRFIGPVDFNRKRRLLTGARCLLVPSLVAETSSLVAMESLACGTPVIAFKAGALPDIIEHGKTGFLVEDERGMAEAISATSAIRAEDCRRAARERFSADRMLARYLKLYEDLAQANSSLHAVNRVEQEVVAFNGFVA